MNSVFTWNCRGASGRGFTAAARNYLEKYKPDIVGFLETRCASYMAKNKLRRLGFDQTCCTENQGFAGGIWVAWKSQQVNVTILSQDF